MDKKRIGEKIRLERTRLGLSQDRIEKQLGLPQKAMTRIESGERMPSSLELAKLAELFHISIGAFFDETLNEDPLVALPRAAPGLEKDPAIQEEVYRCLNLCKEGVALEKLLELPSRQRFTIRPSQALPTPAEAIRQGEEVARDERKRLGLGNGPIHDLAELISLQGIRCAATDLPEGISGLFLCNVSIGVTILINATHVEARQRFSYAHEYAHALFDADCQILVSEANSAKKLVERRANAFAAAFLLPAEGIAEMIQNNLHKGFSSRNAICIYDVSTEEPIEIEDRKIAKNQKISSLDIALIARRFRVSYEAVVYRLRTLEYLSEEAQKFLLEQKEEGKRLLKLVFLENPDECLTERAILQREFTADLSRLVIEAYQQGKISRGRVIELCKLLKLPPQEILRLKLNE